jgi:porphobilinogen synthase
MGESALDLIARPRRNRRSPALRALARETSLRPDELIQPLFVHEGTEDEPIGAMPGQLRLGADGLARTLERAQGAGVRVVALFPKIPDEQKSPGASEAWNDAGLIPRTLAAIKGRFPDIAIVTDVALDPYSSEGHDGLVSADGRILNDETVAALCKQAVCQAQAGADVIAPSDMMDGRVGEIRAALDADGFTEVAILAYTAKYASAYYGPFRDALDSAPRGGDKKTYQMDPANVREALREMELDIAEGADIVMVKPAGPYLDVVRALAEESPVPVAAYQVSGEYSMIAAAAKAGMIDREATMLESLLGVKRAGADMILTYFAIEAAEALIS